MTARVRSFEHLSPRSLEDACAMKAGYGSRATLWAGGTDLLLQWQSGAIDIEFCIDLTGISELTGISDDGESTRIGALTTISALQASECLAATLPVLVDMAAQFATPQIRNLATLGGNLCHAVPSADSAIPLIALDAEVYLQAATGARSLPLVSFFTGAKQTVLRPDEILTAITVPHPSQPSACTFERMARSVVDIALASSACRLTVDHRDRIIEARVALGAVAPTPIRSSDAETLLEGMLVTDVAGEALDEIGRLAAAQTRPITDVRTTASYRKHVSNVLTRRAVDRAVGSLSR